MKKSYLICKNCNTSYNEILDMSPTERDFLLEFLEEESEKNKEQTDAMFERFTANKKPHNK